MAVSLQARSKRGDYHAQLHKTRSRTRNGAVNGVRAAATLAAGVLLGSPAVSSAADYTFDADGAAPLADGSGPWDTTTLNWATTPVADPNAPVFNVWPNSATDANAIFGTGLAGAGSAGTVTVSSGIAANKLTFNTTGNGGNYLLSGGDITLNGTAPTITTNVNATIDTLLNGAGVTKSGAGTLNLTGNNPGTGLTGTTTVTAGSISVNTNNALGTVSGTTGASVTLSLSAANANLNIGNGVTQTLNLITFSSTATGPAFTGSVTGSTGTILFNPAVAANANAISVPGNTNTNAQTATVSVGTMDFQGVTRTINVATLRNNAGALDPELTISSLLQNGNLIKGSAGDLAITSTANTTGTLVINNGSVEVPKIGVAGQPSSIGTAAVIGFSTGTTTQTGTLLYNGSGETTDKTFRFDTVGNGVIEIASSGSGALKLADLTNPTTTSLLSASNPATGTAGRTFQISGSNTGANEVAGLITDASGVVNFRKEGVGTWLVSNPNNSFTGTIVLQRGTLSVLKIGNAPVGGVGSNSNLGQAALLGIGGVSGTTSYTGTLNYVGSGETTDKTINFNSTQAGGVTISANGTTTAASPIKFISPITTAVSASALTTGRTLTLNGTTGVGEFAGVISDNNSAVANGKINFSKTESGTWTVSGANTFSGTVLIQAGKLIVPTIGNKADTSSPLGVSPTYTLGSGNNSPTLSFAGATNAASDKDIVLSSTTNNNVGTISNDSPTSGVSLTINGNVTSASAGNKFFGLGGTQPGFFNGSIANSSTGATTGLQKSGAGDWTVTGAGHTYTGPTNVNAGRLILASTSNISSSTTLNVAANATLDVSAFANYLTNQTLTGNGSIAGQVSLNASGKITPGTATAPGVLTFTTSIDLTNATNTDSKSLNFDIFKNDGSLTVPNDKIVVAGTLNVGNLNPADFNFVPGFPTANAQYTLMTSNNLVGNVDSSQFTLDGFTASLDKSGQNVVLNLTGTPEPTSIGAITGLGVLGLLSRRRRR